MCADNPPMEPTANDPVDPSQWNEDTMAGEPLAELPAVVELLRRRCGVDFSGYKTTTLTRRVRHRMAQEQVGAGAQYLRRLETDEAERQALCGDLLIHVTEFFRDTSAFAYLAEVVLSSDVLDDEWHLLVETRREPTSCPTCGAVALPPKTCASGRRAAPRGRRPTPWPCWRWMWPDAWGSMAM